jgi:hypothetical protein
MLPTIEDHLAEIVYTLHWLLGIAVVGGLALVGYIVVNVLDID